MKRNGSQLWWSELVERSTMWITWIDANVWRICLRMALHFSIHHGNHRFRTLVACRIHSRLKVIDSYPYIYCYAYSDDPARMRSRDKAMPSCLCVCVCVCPQTNIEKCFKQGCKGVYRNHGQRKTISIIILGRFCTWYKPRRFFASLFQLLPIISFVAPPLSKSHVVVTVSNATRTAIRENTGGIDLATYGEACGVSTP